MKGKYFFLLKLLIASELLIAQNKAYQWAKQIGTEYGGNDIVNCIKKGPDGNVYLAGEFYGVIDMDPSAGISNISATGGGGLKDPFFAKYDGSGNLIWAKSINTITNNSGNTAYSIAVDSDGNVYLAGRFSGTVDFDPSANGTAQRAATGLSDIFIAKYDQNGNFTWVITIGGNNSGDYELAYAITLDTNNDLIVTGGFIGTVDFDPSESVFNLSAAAGTDIFLAKYNSAGNFVWANKLSGSSYEFGKSISTDAANNIYLTGSFRGTVDFDPSAGTANLSASGSEDVFFSKYNSSGVYQWANKLSGTGGEEECYGIADASGNLYITGHFSGTTDFDPGSGTSNLTAAGQFDIFLAKYNSAGNYQWAKGFGGTSSEAGRSVGIDASNNVYITGYFNGTVDFDPSVSVANLVSAGGEDIFLAKYDVTGNYTWANKFGSTSSEKGNSLCIDGVGNVLVGGYFYSTIDFDPGAGTANLTAIYGESSFFSGKYNSSGNYIWAFTSFEATHGVEYPYSIISDADKNLYVTGQFSGTIDFDPSPSVFELTSSGAYKCFLAKYDKSGNFLWAKLLTSTVENRGMSIHLDSDGNIILTGIFSGTTDFDPSAGTANLSAVGGADIFIAKYDNDGNYLWVKAIGGASNEYFYSISLDAGNNIFIGGYFFGTCDFDPSPAVANLSPSGPDDIFFAKYDPSGNYLWAKNIGKSSGGSYEERITALCNDESGNLYITGHFQATVDFDPGAGTANLVSAGSDDIFFAKYDASGNYLWAKRAGSTGSDYGWGIKIDGSGNLILSGYYVGTVDFDPGAGTANLASAGSADVFLAKYDVAGNYIFAKSIGGSSYDAMNTLVVDGQNNYYISGGFIGTADFDPSASVLNLTSAGSSDIFIAKYTESGSYSYAINMGGSGSDGTYWGGVTADPDGNICLAGVFQKIADFDPSAGVAKLITSGTDMAIARYGCSLISLASSNQTIIQNLVTNLFYNTDNCNNLIAKLTPSGASPASGNTTAKVWIEGAVPTYAGQPFVARHYEIIPAVNATTATGKVTLYFTQQEFTDFNNHAGSILDLPTGPADATGKANLRIGKYAGTSSNGSGLPGTYSGTAEVIDPVDSDIIWNSNQSRWEVSFNVTGFSGFVVQTSLTILPVKLVSFTGILNSDNRALLSWNVEEQQSIREYIVERSNDGTHFLPAGNVIANNYSQYIYNFTDHNPVSGIAFYRLKVVEDTRAEYSKTIFLKASDIGSVSVYPVPAGNSVVIQATDTDLINKKARLIDVSGKILKEFIIKNLPQTIDISNLRSGVYYIKIGSMGVKIIKK